MDLFSRKCSWFSEIVLHSILLCMFKLGTLGRVHVGLFQHVLDKVEGILDGWEAKLLSLAGRITLAQFVLNSIPLYAMQSTMLHIALCNNLDKKVRQIIWGSLQGYQKIHLVNWEMVTQQR